MTLPHLPFKHIIAEDFEFSAPDGERPCVVCHVAKDLVTGETWRHSLEDLAGLDSPPFPLGEDTVVVAYYASAEMSCHLALGWPLPVYVLDLFPEFRCISNGLPPPPGGASLLGALNWFGLPGIETVEKQSMRELAMRGGPYTDAEMQDLLDYCETDVISLERLLPKMLPLLSVPHALLRGRYMKAVGCIEYCSIPVDTDSLAEFYECREHILDAVIQEIDQPYSVFENRTFKLVRFKEYLGREGIPWPRLESGKLNMSDDTFKDMARSYPQLNALRELRAMLSQMRKSNLPVGADGRNRFMLSAFRSITGRNQPSTSKSIFGQSAWFRGFIRPEPGFGMAYIDWSQQEHGIAAALSGDHLMLEAYNSGDPYLTFAKQAGAVPPDATKQSHPQEREQFKECALAVLYGMGSEALAFRIGQPTMVARELLRLHKETYRVFWAWSDASLDYAMLYGQLHTVFGWTIRVSENPNPRSLRNFPMQANGAEMLRLACCFAVERGIKVCAPIHDALLIEAPLDQLEEHVKRTQETMAEASAIVLNGFELNTDVDIVRYPDRYSDKRGTEMWDTIWRIIDQVQS